MVQIMHTDFKIAIPKVLKEIRFNRITAFRHNLKRGLESVLVVNIHEGWAETFTDFVLNVMCENESRLFTLRPEPNERNGTTAIRLNRRDHHLFKKPVNRSIHGPFRK